ncbi:MAG: MarR family transcriptional regulator [Planctomycetota bacterium]
MPQSPPENPHRHSNLDAVLLYNIARTSAMLGPALNSAFKDINLTAAQFNALLLLNNAGEKGMRMSDIGEGLVVTKSNVTGLVDRLECAGLVERRIDSDRRSFTVTLTDKGRSLLVAAIPLHQEYARKAGSCLDEEEKQTLVKLMTKLRKGLREGGPQ